MKNSPVSTRQSACLCFRRLLMIGSLLWTCWSLHGQQVGKWQAPLDSAKHYADTRNGESALFFAREAHRLAIAAKDKNGEAQSLIEISNALYELEELEKCADTANMAIKLAKIHRFPKVEADGWVQVARYHKSNARYEEALTDYQKALNYRKVAEDWKGVASILNSLSSIYLEQKNLKAASSAAQSALTYLYKAPPDYSYLASLHNNYANILEEINEEGALDSAINHSKKAVEYAILAKDTATLIEARYGLSKRYLKTPNRMDMAENNFVATLKLAEVAEDTEMMAMINETLGAIAIEKKDLVNGKAYLEKAQSLFLQIGDTLGLISVNKNLGDLYRAEESFNKANSAYENAKNYLGGAFVPGEDLGSTLDKEILLNSTSQQKYWQRNILGGIIIVALSITVLIAFFLLRSISKNIALEKANLEANQALLTAKEENLRIREKEAEVQEALNNTRQEELDAKAEVQRLKDLQHWAIKTALASILANLSVPNGKFNRKKVITLTEEAIQRLKEIPTEPMTTTHLAKNLQLHAKHHYLGQLDFRPEIDDAANYDVKGQVCENLLGIVDLAFSNIQSYAEASQADLEVNALGNSLQIIIRDNGKGFDINTIVPGLGLADIHKKATAIGASKHEITSSPGEGTTIEIIVPDPFIL